MMRALLTGAALSIALPASAQPVLYRIERLSMPGTSRAAYDLRLPRLTSGAPAGVRRAVNARIDSLARATYTCGDDTPAPRRGGKPGSAGEPVPGSAVARSTVTRADARFLSVVVEASTYCGGAHPANTRQGYTFDLRTGRLLTFEATFRQDALALTALTREAYRDVLPRLRRDSLARRGDPGCAWPALFDPDVSGSYAPVQSFALTPRGVQVWPYLGHAIFACTTPGFIPYTRVAPHLAPGARALR